MIRTDLSPAESRRRRREKILIAILTVAVVALTYLTVSPLGLLQGSGKLPLATNLLFFGLINLNLLLIILLAFLVLRNVVKLVFERRSRVLGGRFKTKLVVAFFSFAIVPAGLLIIGVWAFMSKSMESWFSLPLDQSLKASLSVAQVYYRSSEADAKRAAKQIGRTIVVARVPTDGRRKKTLKRLIEDKRREYDLASVEVYGTDGILLARVVDPDLPVVKFPDYNDKKLRHAFSNQRAAQMQDMKGGMVVSGFGPIRPLHADKPVLGVVVTRNFVAESLLGKMKLISATTQGFRQVKVLEGPIRTVYLSILTAVSLVVILLSTWFGFFLAKGITVPLQALLEGTEAIAKGNLDYRIEQVSNDEFGVLVNSFNKMTRDLKSSSEALRLSNAELERRRKYMEVVLSNVAAGVISIDHEGRVSTINKSAEKLLNVRSLKLIGRRYTELLDATHLEMVREMVRAMNRQGTESLSRQVMVTIRGQMLALLVSLTVLKDEEGDYKGIVAVFEDLTHFLKAQRALAWREVARRIAHEIKNPLTPIQLSAQRLRKRFLDHLQGEEEVGIFDECTATIVKQVGELKSLVDEFSNFARMPAANPTPNDLNKLVEEVLVLFHQGHKDVHFDFNPCPDLPPCNVDRDQIKRVLLNLLDNAVMAIDGGSGIVEIATAYDRPLQMVRLEVADNGSGIRMEDRGRIFEPYFSTKQGGTGLGLAIVSKIVADHNGYIRVRDNQPRGTRFVIELPVHPPIHQTGQGGYERIR
jgi:two-component system nitrogen regulation sensor histidine kinase NtrY